jgi:hypothetical protein
MYSELRALVFRSLACAAFASSFGTGCVEKQRDRASIDQTGFAGASGVGELRGTGGVWAEPGDWQGVPCDGQQLGVVDADTFNRSIDFVAAFLPSESVLYGEACLNATNAALCRSNVYRAKLSATLKRTFIMTDDDEVLLVDARQELVALLGGTIDSEEEAVLAMLLGGDHFDCSHGLFALGWRVRSLYNGYELERGTPTCDGYRTDRFQMHPSGQIVASSSEGSQCVSAER